MSYQNLSSDIVTKIMDYLDISDLLISSTLCKNYLMDASKYTQREKNIDLRTLARKHTCRNCSMCSYEVEKEFCNDCFIHKCDNCYSCRNSISEFVKYMTLNNEGFNEIKLMCNDFCMYRCHKCKYTDSRHQLFLQDNIELQIICVDCFVDLDKDEKNKYNKVHNNDEWDDLDALD